MAKARALDKRRKSITNIRKITRTMELVSTAQFRRAMDRAVSVDSYVKRMAQLVSDLTKANLAVTHPLLTSRDSHKNAVLFILTANRGMCGGYNSGILRVGCARIKALREIYDNVEVFISGTRGISYLRYRRIDVAREFTQFDHKPSYDDVLVLANECLNRYASGEIDCVDVVYSKFVSISKQFPTIETLLPLSLVNTEESSGISHLEYDFLPSPQSILDEVVPGAFRSKLFKCFLDAAVSEQIARMVAMKAATDNADSMISVLTTNYNRARQSQITNEIIEVISGASALK